MTLAEENMQRLLAKHPDYMQRVMAFITTDPIKPIRQLAQSFLALTSERLATNPAFCISCMAVAAALSSTPVA
jgi:hypothetical protein